jgi:uncharacterized protein (DUF2267 family)
MQFHDFIGHVQHRARLPEEGEALKVTRATLTTLGERLHGGEGGDLGAQLLVAVHHARAVIDVLKDAVTEGEMGDVRAQLPEEYASLFEAGSEGEMRQ